MDILVPSDLLAALDILVAERLDGQSFQVVGTAPAFSERLFQRAGTTNQCCVSFEESPFLAEFLEDAEEFWTSSQEGGLRSAPWVETDDQDNECLLVARALIVAGRKLLTVVLLDGDFADSRSRLQTAREMVLDHRRKRKAAEAADRAKSDFLARMSHDIRTAMNGLIGNLQLISGPNLTDEQLRRFSAMEVAADSLLRLIEDILDLSKINAGRLELDEKPFNLRELVGESVSLFSPEALKAGIVLSHRVSRDVPDDLTGDPVRIRQILTNLLSNAIKFTERGTITMAVESEPLAMDKLRLQVTVSDTGMGIASADQQEIFEAFGQANRTSAVNHGGTGLGLAIARQLVHMMGGSIGVDSEVGAGSKFHFTVCLRRQTDSPHPLLPELASQMKGLPVLVVDEHDVSRQSMEELLAYWKMLPVGAETGKAALETVTDRLNDGRPLAALLVAQSLPDMDVFEFAKRLDEVGFPKRPPIAMITGPGLSVDRGQMEQRGIAAHVTKPFVPSQLLQAVCHAIGRQEATLGGSSRPGTHDEHRTRRQLRILLADDSPVSLEVARAMLEKMGHLVTAARNGKEAVAASGRGTFDLVLMDVEMPEMDGLAATRAIRESEGAADSRVPVVAMTAHAMKGDRERFLQAGMDDYVSKPVRREVLFEIVERQTANTRAYPQPSHINHDRGPEFDGTTLLENVGGDIELARKVIGMFIDTSAKSLSSVRSAAQSLDAKNLERMAHKMKGELRVLGANLAADLALRLESMGRNGELKHVNSTINDLEDEMHRLLKCLVAFEARFQSPT